MRRGRNDGQPKLPLERQVGKALTDEEVATKSQEPCGIYSTIEGIEEEIRTQTRAKKDEIKTLKARAKNIRQAIVDGIDMRKQGTLRYEEAEAARRDLAKVAEAAGEKSDRKPLPSEAHEFQGNGKKDECSLCGGTAADPIHGPKSGLIGKEPPDPAVRTHASRKNKAKGPLGRKRGKEARA